jgi:frataxin
MKVSPVSRSAPRALSRLYKPSQRLPTLQPLGRPSIRSIVSRPLFTSRTLSFSATYKLGLSPGSSDPPAPKTEASPEANDEGTVAELGVEQYHEIADTYLNNLLAALEEKAETSPDIEVEYSVSVLHTSRPATVHLNPPASQTLRMYSQADMLPRLAF